MADPPCDSVAAGTAWLREAEVAVVGLGLMGGSLAGALGGRGDRPRHCRHVVGIVRQAGALAGAAAWVDEVSTDIARVAAADAVVLATPSRTILELLPPIAARLRPGTLLTDLGSTKTAIVDIMSTLPPDLLVVGGHPMCGKEAGGLAAADPTLYQGAPFLLCPVPRHPAEALVRATALALAVGARPRTLDAPAHDRMVAAISHVPYTSAVALVLAAEQLAAGGAGADLWALVAGGFRDTTRVAAGELDMWVDILLTNKTEVLAHLRRLDAALGDLATAIAAEDAPRLRATLQRAQHRRRGLFRSH